MERSCRALQAPDGIIGIDADNEPVSMVRPDGGSATMSYDGDGALIANLRGCPKSKIDARVDELRKVVDLDPEILTVVELPPPCHGRKFVFHTPRIPGTDLRRRTSDSM